MTAAGSSAENRKASRRRPAAAPPEARRRHFFPDHVAPMPGATQPSPGPRVIHMVESSSWNQPWTGPRTVVPVLQTRGQPPSPLPPLDVARPQTPPRRPGR